MRIIHGAGYSDSDRAQFTVLVYRNIFLGMSLLIEAMENLNISYANSANKVCLPSGLSTVGQGGVTCWSDRGHVLYHRHVCVG